jgi:hypothetical protein
MRESGKNFLDGAAPIRHVGYPYGAMLEWVWLRKDNPKPGGTSK